VGLRSLTSIDEAIGLELGAPRARHATARDDAIQHVLDNADWGIEDIFTDARSPVFRR
jgi:hypothetical protein